MKEMQGKLGDSMEDHSSPLVPFLFSTEMVEAILDGRKTVTRRVIKPQPLSRLVYISAGYNHGKWSYPSKDLFQYWLAPSYILSDKMTEEDHKRLWTPPCHSGDILYVRETWQFLPCVNCPEAHNGCGTQPTQYEDSEMVAEGCYLYKADCLNPRKVCWRPSIHMPKEAARIFLRVKQVRIERLGDITGEDCIAEGLSREPLDEVGADFMLGMFQDLWDSTIKPADREKYSLKANPWVWVVDYERIGSKCSPSKEKEGDK